MTVLLTKDEMIHGDAFPNKFESNFKFSNVSTKLKRVRREIAKKKPLNLWSLKDLGLLEMKEGPTQIYYCLSACDSNS